MDFRNGRHASSMDHKNFLYFSIFCLKTGFNPSQEGKRKEIKMSS